MHFQSIKILIAVFAMLATIACTEKNPNGEFIGSPQVTFAPSEFEFAVLDDPAIPDGTKITFCADGLELDFELNIGITHTLAFSELAVLNPGYNFEILSLSGSHGKLKIRTPDVKIFEIDKTNSFAILARGLLIPEQVLFSNPTVSAVADALCGGMSIQLSNPQGHFALENALQIPFTEGDPAKVDGPTRFTLDTPSLLLGVTDVTEKDGLLKALTELNGRYKIGANASSAADPATAVTPSGI